MSSLPQVAKPLVAKNYQNVGHAEQSSQQDCGFPGLASCRQVPTNGAQRRIRVEVERESDVASRDQDNRITDNAPGAPETHNTRPTHTRREREHEHGHGHGHEHTHTAKRKASEVQAREFAGARGDECVWRRVGELARVAVSLAHDQEQAPRIDAPGTACRSAMMRASLCTLHTQRFATLAACSRSLTRVVPGFPGLDCAFA